MTQPTPRFLQKGATLQDDKYQIIKMLGQGGFGITYLAKHATFGEVALKELFLNSGATHCTRESTSKKDVIASFGSERFEKFKNRFTEEAKTLFKLRGVSGVVNVLDLFEENKTVYFSMEYLSGQKLDDYIRTNKGLKEEERLEIIRTLATTLSAVHQRDVLHRDIKPANIIIDENGAPHLIDFGIARSYIDEITETHLHTTFHSPRYSAPEQKIERSRMGTFSDVYSLGATAYFIFTGQQPQNFETRTLEGYISPLQLIPTLSPFINEAINKSLILQPEKRIQTANEFLQLLFENNTVQASPKIKDNQTIIDSPPEVSFNNEQTVIDKTPIKEDKVEETIIDNHTSFQSDDILNSDVTQILPPSVPEKKFDLDLTFLKDWWIQKRNKQLTGGALLLLLLLISTFQMFQKSRSTTLIEEHLLRFYVTDTLNQPLEEVSLKILGADSTFSKNNENIYFLDITKDFDKLKFRKIRIEKTGYLFEEFKISQVLDSIVHVILLSKNKEDAAIFCENISNKWFVQAPDSLFFENCNFSDTINPTGRVLLNGVNGSWVSIPQADGSLLIKLSMDNEENGIHFEVYSPYDSNNINFVWKKDTIGQNPSIFYSDALSNNIDSQISSIKIKVTDNSGNALPNAIIKLKGSEANYITKKNGLTSKIKLKLTQMNQLVISHKDYRTKRMNIQVIPDSGVLRINLEKKIAIPMKEMSAKKLPQIKVVDTSQRAINDAVITNKTGESCKTDTSGNFDSACLLPVISQSENSYTINHPHFKSKNISFSPSQRNGGITIVELECPFCKTIKANWKGSKKSELKIHSYNPVTNIGKGTFNGKAGKWRSSQTNSNTKIILFKIEEVKERKVFSISLNTKSEPVLKLLEGNNEAEIFKRKN